MDPRWRSNRFSLDLRAESEWVGTLEVYLWDAGTLMVEVESWDAEEYLVGELEQDVDDEWEYSGSRAEITIWCEPRKLKT